MLTFIVVVGALTACVVFAVWVLLEIANFSLVKQTELQIKQSAKKEMKFLG